jgi:hypothetical protein
VCLGFKLDASAVPLLAHYVWTNWDILVVQVAAASRPQKESMEAITPPVKRTRSPSADVSAPDTKSQKRAAVNSATHPGEYKEFLRACGNRQTFPVALSTEFTSKKTDLFRTWMNCGKDMEKTSTMTLQRKVVKETESVTEYSYFKKRILFLEYGGNADDPESERSKKAMKKTEQIIDACVKAKNFCPDPDLPDDPEEVMYYKRKGASWFHRDRTAEELSGKLSSSMDTDMANALMGEHGILGSSLSAAVPLLGTDAADNFVAQYMDGEKPTAEQKKKAVRHPEAHPLPKKRSRSRSST